MSFKRYILMQNLPENKKIILFDGVCNLCNSAVQYIIARDKKDIFRFVALQSDLGREICNYIGINPELMDSIILYEPGTAYFLKSDAALEIATEFNSWHSLFNIFKVFPKSLRDNVYDYIAKNRYKWYGKNEHCMIPTPELKTKFL
jgi:predicted DCC family thiol-disulfide oxidoreductase YuxK